MLTHVLDPVMLDMAMRSAVQLTDQQNGGSQSADAFLIRALLLVELAATADSHVTPGSVEQAYESPGMAVMA